MKSFNPTKLITPYFSIIIPVFQDRKRLQLCLNRIVELSHSNFKFEVLVVNNDPNGQSLDINGHQFSFFITELFEPFPGSYAARNRGVQEARGEVLAFIDSDCLPDLKWLDVAYEIFKNDTKLEIGILTGPVPLFFKEPEDLSPAELYEKYTGGFTTKAYAEEGKAITANWFSYKSVIQEFGGFNSELKSNGDSELSGRISEKYKIQYSPNLIVNHPARYLTSELVNKYKRLLGGVYSREYRNDPHGFRKYFIKFLWARYRFALKRLFILTPRKALPILRVCHAINLGAIQEYLSLKNGGETKR